MTRFDDSLKYGQAGESRIAKWLRSRGNTVLPVYEKIIDTGKGPHLFLPDSELIAPDLFVFKKQNAFWIEAKHKKAFTWHRITQRWTTGIDRRHYEDYLKVNESTPWPVYLMFLHEGGQAKDSPPDSPSGLFGETIDYLSRHINHVSEPQNWSPSGMIFWALDVLKKYENIHGIDL